MQEPPPPAPATLADVDDCSFACCLHVRGGGSGAVEDASEVGSDDVVPDVVGDGFEVVVGDEVGHAGVVDEDFEVAVLVDGGLDQFAAVGVGAGVGLDGDGGASGGLDFVDDSLSGLGASEVVDDD